jgi:hypothetical protein
MASAAVVGIILIAINQGDAVLRGEISRGRLVRMLLTLVVPYCVSTYSSVQAMRLQTRIRPPRSDATQEAITHP